MSPLGSHSFNTFAIHLSAAFASALVNAYESRGCKKREVTGLEYYSSDIMHKINICFK